MILKFKTKRDTNGNTHSIQFDTKYKEYSLHNWTGSDYATVNKRDLQKIIENCKLNGYKERG